MTISRFPSGVTTAKKTDLLGDFILPDVTKAHVYWEDFDRFNAADWNIVRTGTPTEELTNVDGGALLVTNTPGASDQTSLRKIGESFLLETDKKTWFETRFKVAIADSAQIEIGLSTPNQHDGVVFTKQTNGFIAVAVRKNTVTIPVSLLSPMTDDTFIRLGFFYNGKDAFTFFADGIMFGSLTNLIDFPDDEELTIFIENRNQNAGATPLTIDYILAAKER